MTTFVATKMTFPKALNRSSLATASFPWDYFLAFRAAPYFQAHVAATAACASENRTDTVKSSSIAGRVEM